MSSCFLITRPVGPGGVAKFYDTIGPYLPSQVRYCVIHDPNAANAFVKLLRFPLILMRFLRNLEGCAVVCLNPSLVPKAYYRDITLLALAKLFGKRVVAFFRGWDEHFEKSLRATFWGRWLFELSYGRADAFIVLGTVFERKLRDMGIRRPIYRMTTVAQEFSVDVSIEEKVRLLHNKQVRCLFMSRLVPGKGLAEAMEMYQELRKRLPEYQVMLTVAGDGPEAKFLKSYLARLGMEGIKWVGYVSGEEKMKVLDESHVLLFPSYGEGLPNVVLESMARGLIILSTKVGGIPDVVEDGKNGVLFSLDQMKDAVSRLVKILKEPSCAREMMEENCRKAGRLFAPETVARRLLRILSEVAEKESCAR